MNKKLLKLFTGDLPDKKQPTKKQAEEKSALAQKKDKPAQIRSHANRIFALLMLGLVCLGLFFGQKLLAKREADEAARQRNQMMDKADEQRKNAALQRQLQQNRQRQQGQHHQSQNGSHMGSRHNGSGSSHSGQMPGMQQPRQQNPPAQGGMAPGPRVKAQIPPMIQPNKRQ